MLAVVAPQSALEVFSEERPPPIYDPTPGEVAGSRMTAFITHVSRELERSFENYESFHRFSVEEPDRFWSSLLDWLNLDTEGERAPAVVGRACETAPLIRREPAAFSLPRG